MLMQTVRWGIIGCGNVTEVKSGPGFQKAEGSQLAAVMRRDAALAQDYAQRHGVPRWYNDAQALIDDLGVDAVYIATPPDTHAAYTLAAARAGKPVYVEKPMALNTAECDAMIAACRSADVPLFVAYYRRALPRFLKVKELVDGGVIGTVRFAEMILAQPAQTLTDGELPWRVRPEIAGGGLFVDLASHTLDFLDYLLGPVRRVQGFAANQAGAYPAEDIVSAAFEFESGVQAVGTWCFNAAADLDRVTLMGSAGQLSFATFADQPLTLETAAGQQTYTIPHPAHIQQPLIQQVVDELRGLGRCASLGESALRTTRVMETLLDEYYEAR
jgi:predicted dehydrogenase